MCENVVEIREVNAEAANALLAQGWKLLEVKTITEKKFVKTAIVQAGWTNKYESVYDETLKVVYIIGRPKKQGVSQ